MFLSNRFTRQALHHSAISPLPHRNAIFPVALFRAAMSVVTVAIYLVFVAIAPNISFAQAPQTAKSKAACKADCQAARRAWQLSAQRAKKSRIQIEKLRQNLAKLDADWDRLAKNYNRFSSAISDVTRQRRRSSDSLPTAKTAKERERIRQSVAQAGRLLKRLKRQFSDLRAKLAKTETKQNAKRRERVRRLIAYRKLAAKETAAQAKLARFMKPQVPQSKSGVYASFEGSFEQCLTYDWRVTAHILGIQPEDWKRYFNRADKKRRPRDKTLADVARKVTKNNATRIQPPYRKNFPCPSLGNGHALNGRQVCRLSTNSLKARPASDGAAYCQFGPDKGSTLVSPPWVCRLYGQKKLGLNPSETANFVRWNAATLEAVCFYFKKSKVASLINDYRVSNEEKQLQRVREQIAKLQKYIAREKALAEAIDKDFRDNIDAIGVDGSVEQQVAAMAAASKAKVKWEQLQGKTDVALGIWRTARQKIENIPNNAQTANSTVASLAVGEAAQRTTDAALQLQRAKYGTVVGIAASIIAVPIEKAWKESIRKDFLAKVDERIRYWDAVRGRANAALAKKEHQYWVAYKKREKYKVITKQKTEHEIHVVNADRKARKLKREEVRLKNIIAAKSQ